MRGYVAEDPEPQLVTSPKQKRTWGVTTRPELCKCSRMFRWVRNRGLRISASARASDETVKGAR